MADGAKLNDEPEGVGTPSEQLTAQHKSAAFADGELSWRFALSQHLLILLLRSGKGVPDATLNASAESKINNVNRLSFNISC